MGHRFTDNQGQAWVVSLDVGGVKRVRERLQFDLLDINESLLTRLATDTVLLVDTLYVLCGEECRERGVSDEEFGGRLVGDAIDDATLALMQALSDFFPSRKRAVLQPILEKIRQVDQRMWERSGALVNSGRLNDAIEKEVLAADAKLEALLAGGDSSGGSPES